MAAETRPLPKLDRVSLYVNRAGVDILRAVEWRTVIVGMLALRHDTELVLRVFPAQRPNHIGAQFSLIVAAAHFA